MEKLKLQVDKFIEDRNKIPMIKIKKDDLEEIILNRFPYTNDTKERVELIMEDLRSYEINQVGDNKDAS